MKLASTSFHSPQFFSQLFPIRHRLGNKLPKSATMIEFFNMANLVDNDIIAHFLWHKSQFVIEVKVPFF